MARKGAYFRNSQAHPILKFEVNHMQIKGNTILIIEHLMKVVLTLSQRILVLHRGQLVSQGDPKTVIQDPVVVEAYLGRKFAERQMKLAHG